MVRDHKLEHKFCFHILLKSNTLTARCERADPRWTTRYISTAHAFQRLRPDLVERIVQLAERIGSSV